MLNTEQYGFVIARAPSAEPDRPLIEVFEKCVNNHFGSKFMSSAEKGKDHSVLEWYSRGTCGYTLSLQLDFVGNKTVEISVEYAHANRDDHIQISESMDFKYPASESLLLDHAYSQKLDQLVTSLAAKFKVRLRELALEMTRACNNALAIVNDIDA